MISVAPRLCLGSVENSSSFNTRAELSEAAFKTSTAGFTTGRNRRDLDLNFRKPSFKRITNEVAIKSQSSNRPMHRKGTDSECGIKKSTKNIESMNNSELSQRDIEENGSPTAH